MAVAPVMLVTILAILMLQLQGFSLMTMVFFTAPLGFIGVVPALLVTRAPLGFVAILGMHGLERHDHAQRGDSGRPGEGRSRRASIRGVPSSTPPCTEHAPCMLTATATMLAMIPLTRSVFWGPMAIAIMGGLTVATMLTIFFVPALYTAWFRVRRVSRMSRRHRS
jgi:multidrug efflux pump subunit AcrB